MNDNEPARADGWTPGQAAGTVAAGTVAVGTVAAGTVAGSAVPRGRDLAALILAESGRAGLRPGSRLPTERELAAGLGVSRTGVRLALAALEADGMISREVGRGTFLREAAAAALAAAPGSPAETPASPAAGSPGSVPGPAAEPAGSRRGSGPPGGDFAPADVMAVRRLIEPQALPLVVLWATARDFTEMERCVAGGDQAASYEEFEVWDLALHRSIITAAHSPLLGALYAVVEEARHGQVWGDLKRRTATRQRREAYQEDHRAIVGALRARDTDAAVEAMRTHLARVAAHLQGESR